jgi:predicted transcriptional regulator
MNFQEALNNLRERGISQEKIADFCGVRPSHISTINLGKVIEPRWSLGEKIRQLHIKYCGYDLADKG